jgi:hypothetical protein
MYARERRLSQIGQAVGLVVCFIVFMIVSDLGKGLNLAWVRV